jgi:hypothetical protein
LVKRSYSNRNFPSLRIMSLREWLKGWGKILSAAGIAEFSEVLVVKPTKLATSLIMNDFGGVYV